jgi:hypothetical protein
MRAFLVDLRDLPEPLRQAVKDFPTAKFTVRVFAQYMTKAHIQLPKEKLKPNCFDLKNPSGFVEAIHSREPPKVHPAAQRVRRLFEKSVEFFLRWLALALNMIGD